MGENGNGVEDEDEDEGEKSGGENDYDDVDIYQEKAQPSKTAHHQSTKNNHHHHEKTVSNKTAPVTCFGYKALVNDDTYPIGGEIKKSEQQTVSQSVSTKKVENEWSKSSKPEETAAKHVSDHIIVEQAEKKSEPSLTVVTPETTLKTTTTTAGVVENSNSVKEVETKSTVVGNETTSSSGVKSTSDLNHNHDNNNFQSEYELKFENIIPDLNEKQEYVVRMDSSITCTSF